LTLDEASKLIALLAEEPDPEMITRLQRMRDEMRASSPTLTRVHEWADELKSILTLLTPAPERSDSQ
jgi:hypothetical protein